MSERLKSLFWVIWYPNPNHKPKPNPYPNPKPNPYPNPCPNPYPNPYPYPNPNPNLKTYLWKPQPFEQNSRGQLVAYPEAAFPT